jgi:hypothetical protein
MPCFSSSHGAQHTAFHLLQVMRRAVTKRPHLQSCRMTICTIPSKLLACFLSSCLSEDLLAIFAPIRLVSSMPQMLWDGYRGKRPDLLFCEKKHIKMVLLATSIRLLSTLSSQPTPEEKGKKEKKEQVPKPPPPSILSIPEYCPSPTFTRHISIQLLTHFQLEPTSAEVMFKHRCAR